MDEPSATDPTTTESATQRRRFFDRSALIGLTLGLLVTAAAAFVGWRIFERTVLAGLAAPQPTAAPAIVVLTAVPSPIPSPTPFLPTPTPIPTLTPVPTPDLRTPPPAIATGYFAVVANTDGVGVRVRGGPSTANAGVWIAEEGEFAEIIGGPAEGSGLTWWQVRLQNGVEGWVAASFVAPAGKPEDWLVQTPTPTSEPDSEEASDA